MNSRAYETGYNHGAEDAEVLDETGGDRSREQCKSKWKMRRHHMHHHWGRNPFRPWGGGSITLMILGFIFMFPFGLLVLAYNIWGNWMFKNSYDWNNWSPNMDKWFRSMNASGGAATSNNAFAEYKNATLKRLEEEEREFMDFMADLRAAKDREEFDRFMHRRKPEGGQDAPSGA